MEDERTGSVCPRSQLGCEQRHVAPEAWSFAMLNPTHPLAELLRRDQRYHFESYLFVFDALRYAQERLNMGRAITSPITQDSDDESNLAADFEGEFDDDNPFDDELGDGLGEKLAELASEPERHVTGQDLCEAIRQYALAQYGLLARSVLGHWGVHSTDDFGEIVFNLIDIGQMRKTDSDRREDFANVYDFAEALTDGVVFTDAASDSSKRGRSD